MTSQLPFSASAVIHVVVSCKSRKVVPVPKELEFSGIPQGTLAQRLDAWVSNLESIPADEIPAGKLYAGDHWAVIKRLASAQVTGASVRVWIASAGYGLVGFETAIKPYTATFVPGHEQAVAARHARYSAADWWDALSASRLNHQSPKTIADLAAITRKSGGYLLLALSAPYAVAMSRDIARASSILNDQLGLVSVGLSTEAHHPVHRLLNGTLLPAGAKLKSRPGLRGAMQGVNSRLADAIIRNYSEWYPSTETLAALISGWMEDTDELSIPKRPRQTDVEVETFVERELSEGRSISKSKMLRQLRDSGLACEQKRFGLIYSRVASRVGLGGAT